jgi:hypothetical protein
MGDYGFQDILDLKIRNDVVGQLKEHDEFIKPEHAEYLARTIPNADFALLNGVTISLRCRGLRNSTLQCLSLSPRFYR